MAGKGRKVEPDGKAELRKHLESQLARLKDATDREGYLVTLKELADELWDARKRKGASRGD
jgi:hypothetical protein